MTQILLAEGLAYLSAAHDGAHITGLLWHCSSLALLIPGTFPCPLLHRYPNCNPDKASAVSRGIVDMYNGCMHASIHATKRPEGNLWIQDHELLLSILLLQRLDVGNNQFAGKFNQLLGALSFLVSFSAEGNMLSGTLPPTMASLGLKVSYHLLGVSLHLWWLHCISL